MASSGALADFGRMQTSRKVVLFVVIFGLLFFVYYRFAYKKLAAETDKEQAAVKKAQRDLGDINDKISKLPEMRASKQKLDRIIQAESKALPEGAEVPDFFGTLERKFTESGVQFVKWARRPEEAVESFVKVPLDVEINGTYFQLKRFFSSLSEHKKAKDQMPGDPNGDEPDRIISVENLQVEKPTIRNREIVMTAKFTAVTFRQEDVKPAAPGTMPANALTPTRSSGTGAGAPPPMPSNALDRVKGKVDDAMQKDEQRVKDGTADPGAGSARKGGQ